MSDRPRPDQFDLFQAAPAADPLIGLTLTLPDSCSKCGAGETLVGPGSGPHLASLRCAVCEIFRGWVGHRTHAFLLETVKQFGRPTTPIAIRRERNIGFINSVDLKILPPSTVATDDRAPPAIDAVEQEAESNGEVKC
jgi:hypothetical protein